MSSNHRDLLERFDSTREDMARIIREIDDIRATAVAHRDEVCMDLSEHAAQIDAKSRVVEPRTTRSSTIVGGDRSIYELGFGYTHSHLTSLGTNSRHHY